MIAIDLMAKSMDHCLYHIGYANTFSAKTLILHKTSKINEAMQAYEADIACNLQLVSNTKILYLLLVNIFSNQQVHILGVNLRQLIFLSPFLMVAKGDITIHLHGQIHALEKKGIKYHLWRLVARKCRLVVANPAYNGPNFVQKIQNLNKIKDFYRERINNSVKIGKRSGTDIFQIEKDTNFNVIYVDGDDSYMAYVNTMKACTYSVVVFKDSYYWFSPSGRLSDAANFCQTVICVCQDGFPYEQAQLICQAYGVPSINAAHILSGK